MTLKHFFVILGIGLTTVGPLVLHLLSPNTVGSISLWLGPLTAFMVQLAALFTAPPSLGKKASTIIPPAACIAIAAAVLGGGACTAQQGQGVVASVPAGIQLAVCVISHAAADSKSGLTVAASVEEIIASCGADVATIVSILDAHLAAEAVDGTTPAPQADAKRAQLRAILFDAGK